MTTSKAKRPTPYVRGDNNNRGAKTVLCNRVIDDIYAALATGVPITYASAHAGCSYESIKRWCQEGETGVNIRGRKLAEEDLVLRENLSRAIRDGKAAFVVNNVKNINDAGKDDWKASAWSLSHAPETREQFSEAGRVRVEVEKRLQVALSVIQRELPPEMFERVLMGISEASLDEE